VGILQQIYNPNLPLELLFDEYTLPTMYTLWKRDLHQREASFYMFHRSTPFKGGYSVMAGLEYLADWIEEFRFSDQSISAIEETVGNDGERLYPPKFLKYLKDFKLDLDVDAVPEGSLIFPHEPMVRTRGQTVQSVVMETFTLNTVNFQSLIATKAARICQAANGDPVFDFGFRRAHGIDGALSASRAAYIGGCAGTSNRLANFLFKIPAKGTHPHCLVMLFPSEPEAFESFAAAMPNNCVLLVDTYSTNRGIQNAVRTLLKLKILGHKPIGIRLDSGDLDYWSKEAQEYFDAAGLKDVAVVGSNDLDEYIISSLKQQGTKISVWGVGTKLLTAYDQPAFGGVWKLSAVKNSKDEWLHKIKLSEQPVKTSNPGFLQVRRYYDESGYLGDFMYDDILGIEDGPMQMIDPMDPTRRRTMNGDFIDLLQPFIRGGKRNDVQEPLIAMRERLQKQLGELNLSCKRFDSPHAYPVGLATNLFQLKKEMILQARGLTE
jgi:nicotinate phosphoribosyltransferase